MGGAVVHLPSAERTAHMISMVLQSRDSTPADVSGALMHLEPICAGMCAAREDRLTEVVPYLEAEIAAQTEQFDDVAQYVPNARRFHEALVSRCGNEPMILLIGSLELIWSAHESAVWSDETSPPDAADERGTMRAALRDHQRIVDAIRDGNRDRAVRLAQDHLAAARQQHARLRHRQDHRGSKTRSRTSITRDPDCTSMTITPTRSRPMTTPDDRVLFDVDRGTPDRHHHAEQPQAAQLL